MRPAIAVAVAAALALGAAFQARANDSTAELPTGGLVLTKSSTIEMRSEDLYISERQVRVRYQFVNSSAQPVTVTVAFPLPDITTNGYDDTFNVPIDAPADFLGFKTLVAGQPVKMQVEQKVLKDGVDRTALLRGMGVPLAPLRDATNAALSHLPRGKQNQLVKLGLAVDPEDENPSATQQLRLVASWTLKTTYYWNQTFPAGRPLAVEHSYTPSVGSFVSTRLAPLSAGADADEAKALAETRRDYCVDDNLMATVRAATPAPAESMPLYYDSYIDYVLVTGANWKVPIGDFRMTIDKGSAANLVSFCGQGVVKTGPTTFQVHYTNFTPTQNVKVILLKKRPAS